MVSEDVAMLTGVTELSAPKTSADITCGNFRKEEACGVGTGRIWEDREDLVRGIGTRQREASTSCFSIASAINLCTRSVGWPESDDRKKRGKGREDGTGG